MPVHELRFHPYLFPVGLGGLPTFSEGGHPERDALAYWLHVRRALARQCVDRIGLGGYLHLTLGYPAFNDAIEEMAVEFRRLRELHAHGAPATLNARVAVLQTWGSLRSWTLSGHFHETDANVLIHINEALSGLPVEVKFVSFDDVKSGALKDVDVLINAGRMGDAWSGGDAWKDDALVAEITRFVYEGGNLIGAGEPSAAEGGDTLFRLAHILGVDEDKGQYACHAPWAYETAEAPFPVCAESLAALPGVRLTDPDTQVFCEKAGAPAFTMHRFGKGRGVYLSGFEYSPAAARMLMDLIACLTGADRREAGVSDHAMVECAWFPKDDTLVVFNNADKPVKTTIACPRGEAAVSLEPLETRIMTI